MTNNSHQGGEGGCLILVLALASWALVGALFVGSMALARAADAPVQPAPQPCTVTTLHYDFTLQEAAAVQSLLAGQAMQIAYPVGAQLAADFARQTQSQCAAKAKK